MKQPLSGFNNTAFSELFGVAASAVQGSANTTNSSSTAPSTSTSTQGKASNHIKAIVGGVVGGVAAIALVCLGAFLLHRRYQKRHEAETLSLQPKLSNETQDSTELSGIEVRELGAERGSHNTHEMEVPQIARELQGSYRYKRKSVRAINETPLECTRRLRHRLEPAVSAVEQIREDEYDW